MSETQYNQGADTFDPEPIPYRIDASEYRDIDLTQTERGKVTTDSSSVDAENERPLKRTHRRVPIETDGSEFRVLEDVQNVGARSYSTQVTWLSPSGDYAAPVPVNLVSEDATRVRVLVSHAGATDTAGIIVGPLHDIQSGKGFFIPAQTTVELKVQGAIYATFPTFALNAVQPTPITMWIERGI